MHNRKLAESIHTHTHIYILICCAVFSSVSVLGEFSVAFSVLFTCCVNVKANISQRNKSGKNVVTAFFIFPTYHVFCL